MSGEGSDDACTRPLQRRQAAGHPILIWDASRVGHRAEGARRTAAALPCALGADSHRVQSFVVAELEVVIEAGNLVRAA
jgi:hypothetical protein